MMLTGFQPSAELTRSVAVVPRQYSL